MVAVEINNINIPYIDKRIATVELLTWELVSLLFTSPRLCSVFATTVSSNKCNFAGMRKLAAILL